MVVYLTGLRRAVPGQAQCHMCLVGLLTADSMARSPLQTTGLWGDNPASASACRGTYSVEGTDGPPIVTGTNVALAYLVSFKPGLPSHTDSSVFVRVRRTPRPRSRYNSAVTGNLCRIHVLAGNIWRCQLLWGELTGDGATGNIVGVKDIGAPSGMIIGAPITAVYSISSSPNKRKRNCDGRTSWSGSAYIVLDNEVCGGSRSVTKSRIDDF